MQVISTRDLQPLKSSALLSLWIKKCSIQPGFGSLVFNRDLSILNPFKAVSKNHNLNSCRQMSREKYEDYLKASLSACLSIYHLLICLTCAIAFLFQNATRPGLQRRVWSDLSFPRVLHAACQPQPNSGHELMLSLAAEEPVPAYTW